MDQVAGSVEKMDILQETAPTKNQILAEGVEKRDILLGTVPMKLWKEVRGNNYNLPCESVMARRKMYFLFVKKVK